MTVASPEPEPEAQIEMEPARVVPTQQQVRSILPNAVILPVANATGALESLLDAGHNTVAIRSAIDTAHQLNRLVLACYAETLPG
jgi:hypothetical protein